MNIDDSVYYTEFTKCINEQLGRGVELAEIDIAKIENGLFDNADIVPSALHDEIAREAQEVLAARTRTARRVKRSIARKWGQPIGVLDHCLAVADLTHSRLMPVVFKNGDVLRGKDPRPTSVAVTGAYLKCLHFLSLHAKACRIGAEISWNLREGFPDVAIARFRTLYEHLVVMMILHNDRTYEVSEAYQDSAVFEYLKKLIVDRNAYSDPFYISTEEDMGELDGEIAEVESFAAEVISRRGPKAKRQYEWARSVLPAVKRDNPNYSIKFTDLEQATGIDFMRNYYLQGNDSIHAGAYGSINQLDFKDRDLTSIRQRRDDWMIYFVGCGLPTLIGWTTRAACTSIAFETEEHDTALYVCEVQACANAAVDAFKGAEASSD